MQRVIPIIIAYHFFGVGDTYLLFKSNWFGFVLGMELLHVHVVFGVYWISMYIDLEVSLQPQSTARHTA